MLVLLRAQAERARLASRECTAVGFFCYFDVPPDVPVLETKRDFAISDVIADVNGLVDEMTFVLFVSEGRMDILEGVTFGESWPNEIHNFKLSYRIEPRSLSLK